MVLFQDSDEYDYYPINRHQISSAMLMQNDYEVSFSSYYLAILKFSLLREWHLTTMKKYSLSSRKTRASVEKESKPWFEEKVHSFSTLEHQLKNRICQVSDQCLSAKEKVRHFFYLILPMAFLELRSVVDEDGETQNTIDSSQSSTFFRSHIIRSNAGVTPGPNVSIKAPSRKMFQSDSHSTLAPLNRGLKTQLKLRETPRNAKNTKRWNYSIEFDHPYRFF